MGRGVMEVWYKADEVLGRGSGGLYIGVAEEGRPQTRGRGLGVTAEVQARL